MSAIVAIGHILGAIVVLVAFGIGILMLAAWENDRNQKAAIQELSLDLGIPVEDIDNAEHQEKIILFFAERFSSEHFRNRLSDLCGSIQTCWGWMGNLLQAAILIGIIWYTLVDDPSNSMYAWTIVGIAFFFWISSVVFGFTCKLLTGRYPGQAKHVRKNLINELKKQQKTKSD